MFYPDFQRYSFHRSPDWRWRRAQSLIEDGKSFSRARDDEHTGKAVGYLRARARHGINEAVLARRYRDIHAAQRLHSNEPRTRLIVEARLLARQTSTEIAVLTDVPPSVVDTFEALFFNCREFLHARDWITAQCIGINWERSITRGHAILFKLLAYNGGPLVLEAARPYLVEGKDLFEDPTDPTTAEGKLARSIRRFIMAQYLSDDPSEALKLGKLMLILIEESRKRPAQPAQGPLLAQTWTSWLANAPVPVPLPNNEADEFAADASANGPLRQTG